MTLHKSLACSLVALAALPALAATTVYEAELDGPSEVLGAGVLPSPGLGSALVTVDTDSMTMHVVASFSGLLAGVTASHIHCCTAVLNVGTAGVATVTPTFTGFPSGVTSGSYDHVFDMNLASSYNPAFITARGGTVAGAFAALAAGLDAGTSYFNIHSSLYPGGEIRGFLAPIPEPATYALMLAGLAAVGFAARRRGAI